MARRQLLCQFLFSAFETTQVLAQQNLRLFRTPILRVVKALVAPLATIAYLGMVFGYSDHAHADAAMQAARLLDGAENRFIEPSPARFAAVQHALQVETERVSAFLESQGAPYAAAWKTHLHWPYLTRNLGLPDQIDLTELTIVRRWLYSNRKGLEYPQFAALRTTIDSYLDAVYATIHDDLRGDFERHVDLARNQCQRLAAEPTDLRAADLGRTLGWFEQTGQLIEETVALRRIFFVPNIQVSFSETLAARVLRQMTTDVSQTVTINERSFAPPAGALRRARELQVQGDAFTQGKINLELPANDQAAELRLVYQGSVESHCGADAGPVKLHVVTRGTARATKTVSLASPRLEVGPTDVIPSIRTVVECVEGESALLRRLGERRANEPQSQAFLKSEARRKTRELLEQEMDRRVDEALTDIRSRLQNARQSMDGFADVLAPAVREGAAPHYLGSRTTPHCAEYLIDARRRHQGGAPFPCPSGFVEGDVQIRIHVSAFENMAETIMAGKTFTDAYFMKYAKIIQAELPPALMVHTRAPRWSIVAAQERPLEVAFPERDVFQFTLSIASFQLEDQVFAMPTRAVVRYQLRTDEWQEVGLYRLDPVVLQTTLPAAPRAVLQQKLDAFFAHLLNGGGVVIPRGGMLGKLQLLRSSGIRAEGEWLAAGIDVPDELIRSVITEARPQEGDQDR